VPAEAASQLRQRYALNALRNSLLAKELQRIMDLLERHGIRAVAFKGVALSLMLYGNVRLRQFRDLDLFIDQRDLDRIRIFNLCISGTECRLKCIGRLLLGAGRSRWTSVSCGIAGRTFAMVQARFQALIRGTRCWCCARMVQRSGLIRHCRAMDWEWVNAAAARINRERVLRLGLGLAHDLLGAPIPDDVLERLSGDVQVQSLITTVRQGLLADRHWPLRGWQLHAYFWNVWPRWEDRRRYVGQVLYQIPNRLAGLAVPCDTDRSALPLPKCMGFVYYLVRFFRLAVRYRSPKSLWRQVADHFS
jgi:hypothetical protein